MLLRSPMPAAASPFEIPPDLRWLTPRYDFVRELGRGMAVVYLARERPGVSDEPGREVAVKVVAPPHAADRETAERFAREARTATALQHPNIVRTLAIEQSGDAVAIVTEYIAGQTLRAVLQTQGALPFDRAAAILRDVAAALAHAHEARIVHRDVKPENIFIETGTGLALLGDFGIARPIDADALLTHDGASLGTPAYMAPEQVDGLPVDARTDVYGLGLVGWEMLAGRRPWQGETLYSLLQKQKHEALPDLARLRPDVPLYLHRAIEGALAKDPRARWHDAAEMLHELSPSPETLPELNAAPDAAPDAASERMQLSVAAGTTVRFASGEVDALRPADQPVAELAVSPEEYARDEQVVAALPPRREGARRRGWIAAAVGAALLAAAATAVHRSGQPTTGDTQLDSLLARTTPAEATGRTPAGPARDSAPRAVTDPPLARRPDSAAPAEASSAAPILSPNATPDGTPTGAPDSAMPAARSAPRRGPAAGAAAPATPTLAGPAYVRAECRSAATADQRRCLMALVYRNDVALQRRYDALIASLRRQSGGAAEPPAVRALRAEQRAWVDARDAECAREVPLARSARWGVARAPCFRGFSDRRAAVLDARRRGRLPQAQ